MKKPLQTQVCKGFFDFGMGNSEFGMRILIFFCFFLKIIYDYAAILRSSGSIFALSKR